MQIIRELEREPRGIVCGAIGFIAPNRDAAFSVAIRTLVLQDGRASMRVGSGITWDSVAESEYAECRLKAEFLARDLEPFELIETMRWDGEYFLLDLHLARLRDSAEYFGFAYDEKTVRDRLQQAADGLTAGTNNRVRLTMGLSGKLSVTSAPLELSFAPVSLALAGARVLSADPFLRHKTTRRAIYDRALVDARAAGFDDGFFLNERGEVTECSVHNIVIKRNGELLTPALDCGVLPGIYRAHLLNNAPGLREAIFRLEDMLEAEQVYVCNSVRGMRAVHSIRLADGTMRQFPVD
jgi:para-aminobenzoate synthetase/4-amino-4-deoxychorismate lyase